MNSIVRFLNIFLILAGVGILSYSVSEYCSVVSKLEFVKKKMLDEISEIENITTSCEEIAKIEDPLDFYRHQNYNKKALNITGSMPLDTVAYSTLKYNIDILCYKRGLLTSHAIMVIDKFSFMKDAVSDKLHFGTTDFSLISCESYSVKINDKLFETIRSKIFEIPKADTLRIEYFKYFYNYYEKQIDTIKTFRTIVL